MNFILDFLRNYICLLKLPFLASLSLNFSTRCSHMLSKFIDKSAQKASIFSNKANYAKSLLTFFLFLFTACSGPSDNDRTHELNKWKEANNKIKVLTTTRIVDDLVKEIGKEFIDSMPLIKGDLDPHSYTLVKGDDEKFQFADLIFFSGLGLEHGPGLHHYLYENPKAINLGQAISSRAPDEIIYVNQQIDPHIWMDVSLWSHAVPVIVETLSKFDPQHAHNYETNGKNLELLLQNKHSQMTDILNEVPPEQRYLVTSHDAFNYFAKAYLATPEERKNGLWNSRAASPEGLAPDSQLSPADIQNIIKYVSEHQIHILFFESNVSKDSIRKILSAGNEKQLHLIVADSPLFADAMGPQGSAGDTYLKMMEHNALIIKNGLLYNK